MLLASGLPDEGDHAAWAAEVKWDGMRVQLRVEASGAWSLRSRHDVGHTARFAELDQVASAIAGRQALVDGELVCLASDGKPDFDAIRDRLRGRAPRAATLVAFDLLHLDGFSLRPLPYLKRRRLLAEVLADGPAVRVPAHWTGDDITAAAAATREHGLEGIVCKRLDAPYRSGRSSAWLKHKHRRREQLQVTGWRPGAAEPDTIYLARVDGDGRRRYAGDARPFGLDADAREQLRAALRERAVAPRRKGGIWNVSAGIAVTVDAHGRPGGPLRDAILRDVDVL
jgi:bifunctional non-homologous end joining protein LigD